MLLYVLMSIDNLPSSECKLHWLILEFPGPQFLLIPVQLQQFAHISLGRDLRVQQLKQINIILVDKHLSLLAVHGQFSFGHPLAYITVNIPILAPVVMLLLQVMIKMRKEVLVYKFLNWVGLTLVLHLQGADDIREKNCIIIGEMN